jgi:hypothetical protein
MPFRRRRIWDPRSGMWFSDRRFAGADMAEVGWRGAGSMVLPFVDGMPFDSGP